MSREQEAGMPSGTSPGVGLRAWLGRLLRGLAGALAAPAAPERMPCLVLVGAWPAQRFRRGTRIS
jgi:hypothetical protein